MFPKNHNNKIRLLSGGFIHLLNPKPEDIHIPDIGRGLSNKGHYGGHTPRFFSIAEHSVMVVYLMRLRGISDPILLLIGLLHDAAEAYLGDCVKPLKDNLPEWGPVEKRMTEVIFERFGLPINRIHEIKSFDMESQRIEWDVFYEGASSNYVKYLSPEESFDQFMKEFNELVKQVPQ